MTINDISEPADGTEKDRARRNLAEMTSSFSDDIDNEPADEPDEWLGSWFKPRHHHPEDRLGRALLVGLITCAVLAAAGIAGFLCGAW